MNKLLKRFLILAVALSAGLSFAQSKGKAAVVYYSLTETTTELAERLSDAAGADIFRLECKEPYSMQTVGDESRNDKANNVHRELSKIPDLKNYGTIFIGTPVWSGRISNPVETWLLEADDLKGKTVVPFCTYWSSGNEATLSDIANLAQKKGAKTVKGFSQAHGETFDVSSFVKGL